MDGTLDKMVGDQVMAFFGTPFREDSHAQRAVQAALGIMVGMQRMAEGGDEDAFRVGGGVGTGEALVGNVAEGEVADFTAIGDVVNTTARLQGGPVRARCCFWRIPTGRWPTSFRTHKREHSH